MLDMDEYKGWTETRVLVSCTMYSIE